LGIFERKETCNVNSGAPVEEEEKEEEREGEGG
jgi:hypothetical protein